MHARSASPICDASSGWIRLRTSDGTGNLVLAAEFIPLGRVVDHHDVAVAAAPRLLMFRKSWFVWILSLRTMRHFVQTRLRLRVIRVIPTICA